MQNRSKEQALMCRVEVLTQSQTIIRRKVEILTTSNVPENIMMGIETNFETMVILNIKNDFDVCF